MLLDDSAPLGSERPLASDSAAPLLLGVDTGGTYTDAVLLDRDSRVVVASAKALTTRADLAVGVTDALEKIMQDVDPSRIASVAISTTLATNAVVEGHGSPVLVVLVGFDEPMVARTGISEAFRDAVVVRVGGGHDHYGNERTPLDREALVAVLAEQAPRVSAVAVASTFAVRNPAHEQAVREMVLAETSLPVTLSSSLSESLDAPRRALTTALNARLLSRVSALISAVQRSLDAFGVDAPMMVAKGDGSLAAAASVARRPIETVMSGPAASIVGAAVLTGLDDFVLSDIGGTTTDVGQLRAGRPRLSGEGAQVGGWRTMVEAIDVRTTGLGGDSAVRTDKTDISLGPERRVPLSLIGVDNPSVRAVLKAQRQDPPSRDLAGAFVVRVLVQGSGATGDAGSDAGSIHGELSAIERRILERTDATTPVPLADVAAGAVERRSLSSLVERGLVQVAGFTPSDAAHVLGLQDNWDGGTALLGAELLGWYTSETAEEISQRVFSEMVRRSAGCVLDVAFGDRLGADSLANPLVDAVASAGGDASIESVRVSLSMATPIVAVGGPAGVYYEAVAQRCGADLVLPEQFAVANAVGAAAGEVVVRTKAEVHADGPGQFRVVTPDGTTPVGDPTEAIERATQEARTAAARLLADRCAGLTAAGEPTEFVEVERYDAPDAEGDEGLYSAVALLELRVRPLG